MEELTSAMFCFGRLSRAASIVSTQLYAIPRWRRSPVMSGVGYVRWLRKGWAGAMLPEGYPAAADLKWRRTGWYSVGSGCAMARQSAAVISDLRVAPGGRSPGRCERPSEHTEYVGVPGFLCGHLLLICCPWVARGAVFQYHPLRWITMSSCSVNGISLFCPLLLG